MPRIGALRRPTQGPEIRGKDAQQANLEAPATATTAPKSHALSSGDFSSVTFLGPDQFFSLNFLGLGSRATLTEGPSGYVCFSSRDHQNGARRSY